MSIVAKSVQKIVADTNIYISALLFGGLPDEVLKLARKEEVEIFISHDIYKELEDSLANKFNWTKSEIENIISGIGLFAHKIEPKTKVAVVSDPDDNRILECAIEANADAIISGDRHLLKLKAFRGIPILTPRIFLSKQE